MKKAKRILALAGVILLIGMYASTLIFALMDSPTAKGLLMGSIACTIIVPVILYGMTLVTKNLKHKGEELKQERQEQDASENADGTHAD